jgi:hypothetical protein
MQFLPTLMTKRPALLFLTGSTLLVCLAGCAIVTKGFRQDVSITSSPAGAAVVVDGVASGKTPLVVSLARGRSHRVELSKDGFVTGVVLLNSMETAYESRPVRWGLDIDSGASNDLVPGCVNFQLVAAVATPTNLFEQMKAAVDEADRQLSESTITEAQHHDQIERILARFSSAPH